MIATAPALEDPRWLYEVKFDGYRCLAVKNGRSVTLFSRNQKLFNGRFPAIVAAVARLPVTRCILDGELVALDAQGKSSFQLLQNAAEGEALTLLYHVFDLPFDSARDLRPLPLLRRKEHLARVLKQAKDPIRLSAYFTEEAGKVIAGMRHLGLEGAIAKLKDSPYEAGRRSPAWIKIKFIKSQEFVIGGYTLPDGGRSHFGSLLLGYYDQGRLIFSGKVGTGFNHKMLASVYRKMKALQIEQSPFQPFEFKRTRWQPTRLRPSDCRWIRPKLVCNVTFTEWTAEGSLRHPSFQGLREDKRPTEVIREPEAPRRRSS